MIKQYINAFSSNNIQKVFSHISYVYLKFFP